TISGAYFDSLAVSPDGQSFAAGDMALRRTLQWRVSDGQPLHSIGDYQNGIAAVAISPHKQNAAAASNSGDGIATLGLWSTAAGAPLLSISAGQTLDLAFFSDELLASATGRKVIVWRASDGSRLVTLSGTTASIRAIAISPDRRMLS